MGEVDFTPAASCMHFACCTWNCLALSRYRSCLKPSRTITEDDDSAEDDDDDDDKTDNLASNRATRRR